MTNWEYREDYNNTKKLLSFFQAFLLVFLLFPACLSAGQKTLSWPELKVEAKLDHSGTLHIREYQTMLFSGAWNGGERIFRITPGQRLIFHSISRQLKDGQWKKLEKGNLKKKDHWAWHNSKTLRWRARLPSEPVFASQKITWLLEYSLSKILTPITGTTNNRFLLNHDFAFPDRSGVINHFSLNLEMAPTWQQIGFPLLRDQRELPPGKGVIVRKKLIHMAGTDNQVQFFKAPIIPIQVHVAVKRAPRWLIATLTTGLLLLLVFSSLSFFRHERAAGRFGPGPSLQEIDESWLENHVFHLLPETVGATWDRTTNGHEVAAVLARLVVEKKMSSRVEQVKLPFFGWNFPGKYDLHMELLVDRRSFQGYEKALIDGFFIDGDTTDTIRIKQYYREKKTSFQPSLKIKGPVEKRVKKLTAMLKNPLESRWLISVLLFVLAFFVLLAQFFVHQEEVVSTFAGSLMGLICVAVGCGNAIQYRKRSDRIVLRIVLLYLFPMLAFTLFIVLSLIGISSLLAIGIFFITTCAIYSAFLCGKCRDSLAGVRLSKELTAARIYFKQELKKQHPAIRDEWFPYLLAFGLGSQVDKWTKGFGNRISSRISTNMPSGNSASFSGGGGLFGGGGASGSWAVAASSLGVATSSSSGSSGGGGGSSGGGGGGGW